MKNSLFFLELIVLVGICVEEIIAAFCIVVVGFKRHEIVILNIGKSCTAASAELEAFINLCITFRADLIASDSVKLKSHLLDSSASCIDVVTENLE